MPNFRATVRFHDVPGPDVLTARKTLEERIQTSGLGHWRVVDIVKEGATRRSANAAAARWRTDRDIAGKLMIMGAAVWAVWFFWILAD
ncbi:MAG: hypothetical protein HYR72_18055 [Deltaproteobacteria bacterium]|jgi:hypothetical protein|nr:hypothetical protein [Deltaproteobacteria bacterium]MBI3386375.1 hypothetical protein [Deltaproteobacteria bacterium]